MVTMQLLSDMASRGTTIVCSLHQPRPQVYHLLDRVLLMSRGQVAFFGPPAAAPGYFASVGRPLDGGGERGVVGGVEDADAMLDIVGDAEIAEDGDGASGGRAEGERGGGLLVLMDRDAVLEEVGSSSALCGCAGKGGGGGAGLRVCVGRRCVRGQGARGGAGGGRGVLKFCLPVLGSDVRVGVVGALFPLDRSTSIIDCRSIADGPDGSFLLCGKVVRNTCLLYVLAFSRRSVSPPVLLLLSWSDLFHA